jgi:membrane dipeptidase
MTDREKLYQYFMSYWCEDDPEIRALVTSWNENISDEAKKLHDECIIIDGCTFYIESYNWQLQQAKPTALNLTVPSVFDPSSGGFVDRSIDILHTVRADPAHFMSIRTAEDILEAKRTGKVGLIFGAQNCDFILNRDYAAAVELFARMGLRIMQIAYHTRSFAADGCASGVDSGITEQGKQLIRAMEANGITVDLSHVGCRSTLEAMDYAEKPMIFSHSNPKALFNHFRNITDEQAKKCASIGGVIGVVGFSPILYDGTNLPSVERFVDAVVYYADLIGIDHIGIGLDSNAEPGAYTRHDARRMAESYFGEGLPENFYDRALAAGRGKASVFTDGIYGVASYPNIVAHLLKRGFSHEDVKKVMGGNFLRVFQETWKK